MLISNQEVQPLTTLIYCNAPVLHCFRGCIFKWCVIFSPSPVQRRCGFGVAVPHLRAVPVPVLVLHVARVDLFGLGASLMASPPMPMVQSLTTFFLLTS